VMMKKTSSVFLVLIILVAVVGCGKQFTAVDPDKEVFKYRDRFEKTKKHDVRRLKKILLLQRYHVDEMVRFNVSEVFGEFDDERMLEVLWKMILTEDSELVRIGAVNGMMNSQSKASIKYLVQLLDDKNADVRRAAARGCGEGDKSVLKHLLKAYATETEPLNKLTLAAAMAKFGNENMRHFVVGHLFDGVEPMIKKHSLDLIINFELDVETKDLEFTMNQEADHHIKILFASLMARNGSEQGFVYLKNLLLGDQTSDIKLSAAKEITEMGHFKSTYPFLTENLKFTYPFLVKLLKDDSEAIREFAIEELVEYNEFPLVPILGEVLKNDDSSVVREISAWVMGERKKRDALPYLEMGLYDNNADVRTGCLGAIYKILIAKYN